MSVKQNKGLLREELLKSLNDCEKIALVQVLRKIHCIPANDPSVLYNVDVKTLFGFLHNIVFGCWGRPPAVFERILANIPEVRAKLGEICRSTQKTQGSGQLPRMPEGFQISNPAIGTIFVSFHAWNQFCRRICPESMNITQEKVVNLFANSFARATQVQLAPKYAVLRTINNGFKQALYFYNDGLNCRFVVRTDDGKSNLVTVERPYPQKH